jgi:hypothetical protein
MVGIVDASKLDELKDLVEKAFVSCVNTENYNHKVAVTDDVYLTSKYFENGNRRVNIVVFGQEFEMYSAFDREDISISIARVRYATQYLLGSKYHELKKLFD